MIPIYMPYPVYREGENVFIFLERLENAFKIHNPKKEIQLPILLNQMDDGSYRTLRNICRTVSPSDLSIQEVQDILKKHRAKFSSSELDEM
jgi:hypothetical protein